MHEDGSISSEEEMLRNIYRRGSPIWTGEVEISSGVGHRSGLEKYKYLQAWVTDLDWRSRNIFRRGSPIWTGEVQISPGVGHRSGLDN